MNKIPLDFHPENTTCWSFPERGSWATHNPKYRGNFAPQIPRNIILNYSDEGDTVLDPMVGSGTTLIECKLLHRDGIGFDINPSAVKLTKDALEFEFETKSKQYVSVGDVRTLKDIKDNSIDLICTHPPYLNLVTYSNGKIEKDLSNISSPAKFCDEFRPGIEEMHRVLKPDRYCAILIGDTRKGQHYVPLAYFVLQEFLKVGFALKEDIIKAQHNCTYSKHWTASAKKYKFYLIMHEHLFVFRKPRAGEDLARIRWSVIR
ncbi:MAG: DNA methyltransferase [candidate division Zixibacteria bacterium]|nr:DNA methyltransferase [candidate division Zixibacteria bacterium]MDD5425577.1 DNA methyltransferase [candidate division Zixibacteria bacterium]